MASLAGKVALITGGSRGQGAAAAEARLFVESGAVVAICDVLREEGQALAAAIGAGARFIPLDGGFLAGAASRRVAQETERPVRDERAS